MQMTLKALLHVLVSLYSCMIPLIKSGYLCARREIETPVPFFPGFLFLFQVISTGVSQVDSEEEWKVVHSVSGGSPTKSDSSPPSLEVPTTPTSEMQPVLAAGERVGWCALIRNSFPNIFFLNLNTSSNLITSLSVYRTGLGRGGVKGGARDTGTCTTI